MKKLYKLRYLYFKLFLLVMLASGARATAGYAQAVSFYPVGSEGNYYPYAKNIAPGSNNNIIALFSAHPHSEASATVNSITVTTAGNYATTDLKANGFKLWYASGNNFDPTRVNNAMLLSTKAVVASGGNLVFSNLSREINGMDGAFFYITADVAEGATLGRTLYLTATPQSNFVLASGPAVGTALPAPSIQTIGIPLPEFTIYGYNGRDNKISPGSTKNELYDFQIMVREANGILRSLTVPTRGTFTAADVAPNGFRLWHMAYSGNYEEVLAGTASLAANGNIVFSNLNVPLNVDGSGTGYHGLRITVDLASGATPGRTIGTESFPLSNFTFERTGTLMGHNPMPAGSLNTIAVPAITISSLDTPAGVVSPGSVNSVLYKLGIRATNANATFTSMRFTTGGTYQASDITRFKLYAGDEDEFENDELIATTGAVASGGELIFNLTDATLPEGENVVLYLVADLAPGAVAGRTIRIQAVAPSHLTAKAGTISGSTTAGGIKTITLPSVVFTPAGPPAGIIAPGTFAVLHSVKVDVTAAPATFTSAAYQLSGTFQSSDLGDPYDSNGDGVDDGVEGVYLVYHRNPNLMQAIDDDEEENDLYLLSYSEILPTSGSTLTFTTTGNDEDVNPTIPLGTGYITVVTIIRETAVLGRTIQASTSGTAAFTLASGNKTGTTGTGGIQTIGASSVAISSPATPAGNVGIGTPEVVLYRLKLDVTNAAAILKEIQFTTGGTYSVNDIYGFELYVSKDAVFNPNEDYYIGYESSVASGSVLKFDDLDNMPMHPGSSTYLFVVANASNAAPGKTINIAAMPASAFTFLAANVSGTFPLAAGGVQTFVAPTLSTTFPAVSALTLTGGTNNAVIHRFNITASGADAYPQNLMLNTLGNYQSSDLNATGIKLWFNTANSFAGSRIVSDFGPQGSGSSSGNSIRDVVIKQGTTGYFFITADVAPSAVAGRTMQVQVESIYFPNGPVTLPVATNSPVHTIGQPVAMPTIAVSVPSLPAATLQKGSADNVIYQFNIAATGANAIPNYLELEVDGSFATSDLAVGGLKLWRNTTNSFAGSTLVQTFAPHERYGYNQVAAALSNVQVNAGTTGYFFITATVSANAGNNRTIRIDEIDDLQFAAGTAQIGGSRGSLFTINSTPLSILPDTDINATLVYPNPYRQTDILTIETNSTHPKQVFIYTATGKVVSSVLITEKAQLELKGLSKGLYLIQVQHLKENRLEVMKLLVQ